MKFFGKKGDASASRRRARLWVQRLKAGALYGGGAGAVIGLFVYAWIGGLFSLAGSFALQKTVDISAAAGFKVSDILVVGRKNTAPEELLAHLGISAGDPLFGVSIADGQSAIADIPWAADVTVARRLPGTVVVTIRERTPAALWQYQKKLSLIDAEGHVLSESNLDSWRHLPLVVGEHAPQDVAKLLGLLHAEPEIAQQLAAAVRIGSRRWDLRLKNGVLVKLPENDVELALRRLALMGTEEGLLARGVKHIDMRLAGKIAVEPEDTDNSNI
jgi:cell division protein FtsQ